MKRFLVAVIAVAGVVCVPAQLSAQGFADSFRFEFGGTAPDPHDTDSYRHRSDFVHHRDYYVTPGYSDPYNHTSCNETRFQGEDGRTIRRITCYGRNGTSSVPVR